MPFGSADANWIKFKSGIQPGDKIYDFASSPESWASLAGRAGYVLVRNGKPVDTFVTLMN